MATQLTQRILTVMLILFLLAQGDVNLGADTVMIGDDDANAYLNNARHRRFNS